ncbi:hypothetical protein ALT1545_10300 [Alteromonas macleodii]
MTSGSDTLPFLWPFFASSYFENRVDKQNNFNAHTSMYVEPAGGLHCRGLLCYQ